MNANQEEEVDYLHAENFVSLMNHFRNNTIQINQGGPDAKNGLLLEVINDYLVLQTNDDGIVYYNIHHIKSVKNAQKNMDNKENIENTAVQPEFLRKTSFNQLFMHMTHSWVSINRNGPEALEGILVENTDGYYTLINNQEVFRIHPFHVRSISVGPKGALKQENNENKNDNKQEESSSEENVLTSSDQVITSSSSDRRTEWSRTSSRNRRSTGERRTSRRNETRRSREKVVKSIDYTWKTR